MPFGPAPKVNKKDLEDHLSRHFELGKLLSYKKLKKGRLCDVAPTILTILNLEIPKDMTGEVLVYN